MLTMGMGIVVKNYRMNKNESVSAFAKHCHVAVSTIKQLENYTCDSRLGTLRKIANYMGLSLYEFWMEAQRASIIDNAQ